MTRMLSLALGAALALAGPASAGTPEDDLAVVKKAVSAQEQKEPEAPAKLAPAPMRKGDKPQWLKVRVVEKAPRKAKVSINLPLSLARAVGDDLPIDWHCHHRDKGARRCEIKLSEILAALESGQDLVEIESDDATVRVWVE